MSPDSPTNTAQPVKKPRKNGLFTAFVVYFLLGQFLIIALAFIAYNKLSVGLPSLEELEKIREDQNLSTNIYSSDGVLLRSLHREKRFWVNYNEIPQCMIDAVIAAEDSRFFKHWGVSLPDIMRAAYVNIRNIEIEQGASTITQQLARTLFLTTALSHVYDHGHKIQDRRY
ncbi:Biosynthetic peptidoglycan transglycosylase [subsurface metagenome]